MLVLSRKSGENILVPEHGIVIRILEVRQGKVRLGITAPPECEVFREEVWERLRSLREDEAGARAEPTEEHGALSAPRPAQQ